MARLTKDRWEYARNRWEGDPREGFDWLANELNGDVSRQAISKMAKKEGWAKGGVKVSDKVAQPNKKSCATKSEVAQPEQKKDLSLPFQDTNESVDSDIDKFGSLEQLTDKQEIFVREYMVDWNATQAAIRAGYSHDCAQEQGSRLLSNAKIRNALQEMASARAKRLGIDAEEMLKMWAAMIAVDVNEISQLRRVCCPFCWGEDHKRQYTPSGLEEAQKKHDKEREKRLKANENDDIGDFPVYTDAWYDRRKPLHEDCPECHGEGVELVFFNDTRNLSPAAKFLYSGIKSGRDGIEVLMLSREKAMDNMARALGMFKESEPDVNVNVVASDELLRVFEEKMRMARERQAAVLAERSLLIGDSDT